MPSNDRQPNGALARWHRGRAARFFTAALLAIVAYAAWRGYQSPDFLIGVAAAFGLC